MIIENHVEYEENEARCDDNKNKEGIDLIHISGTQESHEVAI